MTKSESLEKIMNLKLITLLSCGFALAACNKSQPAPQPLDLIVEDLKGINIEVDRIVTEAKAKAKLEDAQTKCEAAAFDAGVACAKLSIVEWQRDQMLKGKPLVELLMIDNDMELFNRAHQHALTNFTEGTFKF